MQKLYINYLFKRIQQIYNLNSRCLQDEDVLRGAMSTLEEEINPWDDPSEASIQYRKQLTKGLLYKVSHTHTHTHNTLSYVDSHTKLI